LTVEVGLIEKNSHLILNFEIGNRIKRYRNVSDTPHAKPQARDTPLRSNFPQNAFHSSFRFQNC